MKNSTLFLLLLSILGFLFSSCEESRVWELENTAPKLIVEAVLTDEYIRQEVKLSQSFNTLNEEPPKLSGATVWVDVNGIKYTFSEDPLLEGLYKSDVPFSVVNNLEYSLYLEWEDEIYEAVSELAPVTPWPNVFLVPNADSTEFKFGDFYASFSGNQQSMYEMFVDWSHQTNNLPNQSLQYFYTFSKVHISELFKPTAEDVFFPRGSKVIAKKYGLNDDFADYLRSKQIETTWNGTFFFTASENLPTNISNGGLGFFSTCSVLADSIIVPE